MLGSRAVPLGPQLRPGLAAGLAREEFRPTRRRPSPLNRKRTAALNRAGRTLPLSTLPPPLVLLRVVLALVLSTVLRPLAAPEVAPVAGPVGVRGAAVGNTTMARH
jgi:hypothetical protein